ncbi:aldehyde dehydrogenase family protein [Desulfopila sp. IMCC35006]|uniref:aldehyde dehydrogenase family protein n=1 Tax=Desulfopila sp. IMCC35006 TaxID=2569542 RepID=UPI0010AD6397|nr:aldehyde dehydrogenase family protein [Desulfopila sp. IMCC35006]TKB26797.1 aldehyde dehydrogenase family protein [Desulfopila sp. IMCC35006]
MKKLWINGEWLPGESSVVITSPYDGASIGEVAVASRAQVALAVQAAERAKPAMRTLSAYERGEILDKVADLFKEHRNEAAAILSAEAAKPINAALLEIDRTVQTYHFAADEARRLAGEMVPIDAAPGGKGRFGFTLQEPVGIIGAISPFNFPFNLVAHKVGPAIAAGNTVILKPASQTPFSAYFTAEMFHAAGLPAGALNVVSGSGAVIGEALVEDERVAMITFTGSPPVGRQIRAKAGLKKVTLELGSNSAVIIDQGVEIDGLVDRCVVGAFSFQGQICISLQRIFVHRSLYPELCSKMVTATSRLHGGAPGETTTDYSALISEKDARRVHQWIKDAEAAGATLLCGGELTGNMVAPAILTNVARGVKVSCQEVFGPVVVISPFDTLDEAIDQVNDSVYGLQAGIYTPLLDNALHAARKLEVGGVMINDIPTFRVDQMPYGGVKESGIGREGLRYAVAEMTEMKLVVVKAGR